MENEKLSVIIPVYNTAPHLATCLESVLQQDYQDIEIICVNDASTDNSEEILKRYSASDSRIRIINHEKNRGLLNARRTGVENSSGGFIQFLDSDDTIDKKLCSSAVDLIKKHNTDFLQFSCRVFYTEKKHEDVIEPPNEKYIGQDILFHHYVTMHASTSIVFKIYRRELCQKAFEAIPDMYCYVGEDILSTFFISFFARSYIGMNTKQKYNYYFGKGVSSDNRISYDKFFQFCEMSKFPKIVEDFLLQSNSGETAFKAAEYMNYRLISDCCHMFALVSDVDKERAVECFWNHWSSNPYFAKGMMRAFNTQFLVTEEVRNSESYRIGNAVVTPLRNLRSLLFSKTR